MQPVFWIVEQGFCQYPILQIEFNEFSKTNIKLTMTATEVGAIVKVVGVFNALSTVVSAF